ncbi:hypothetical protein FOA52_014599 [Chlamydomonas sp. UWO 241]|nr:hypothetical protein FOA52_014599 [Chlamydomonas sp. UWO 241]
MASPATPQALPSDSPRIAPHSAPPASYIGPNDARFRRALEAKMVVVDPNMLAGMDDSHAHEQHQQRRLSYSTDKGPDVSQRGSVHLRLFSQAADRERRAEERRLGLEADAMADARQSATKAKMSWVCQRPHRPRRTSAPFGSYGEMLYAEGLEAEAGKRRRAEAQRKERAERELIGATFSPEITPLARELRGGSDSGDPVWERLQLTQQARFAADRGQMITIVSAYSPTEAASDEEAGDFYLRVAALADKANDKRDLLIVAGGSQRRAWDSSQLRRPAVRREFNLQLSDRFGLLEAVPPEGADAQAEYDAMAAAIREVATNHLAPRGSRRRRGWQFTLSQRTLRLMDARQRAHTAWLRSKSAAAKRERNRANRAADAAVQRDRERWIGQQVAEAQDMLRKKNLRQFARACDRLAGRSRSHQIPPAMRDVSGALHSGPDGVLKAMTESFDKLYGGETKLSDETLNQLENDVAAFELTRATEVDEAHGRPPDLAETEACMQSKTLAKAAQQQAAKEQHMAAECTFHPRIDARSKAMMSARSSLLRTCNVSPHEQLFQDSIRRQAKQEELSTWVPDEVTFQPAVNKDELAQKWFRRSMEGFSRSPGMPKERQVSVIDRLYASHEKAKSKLEAKRTVLQSTDPVTGQQLFQPEVNKTPRSGASTPQRARPASAGRAQRPDAPDSIYSQLYAQALESQTRKRDAAAAARAKSAGTSAQRHVNSSSDRQYARLTSERFAQVFDYLDTDCDGKIDLIAIIRAPVSRIDDLDAEVRGDVELASQAHAKANGVPLLPESFGDMGSLEAVEAALAALPPAPLVTRDAFGALMAGALRLRRGPRMYLTPTPGHSASQAPGTPEGTFSPAINARSRALAEQSLRPPGVPSHELLHAMASQVASKRATKAAEARAAELNGCTFQPALLPHAGGSAQHVRNPGPGVRSPGGGSATHTTQAPASPPPAAVRTRWNGGVASSPGRGEPGAQDLAALEREVRAALAGVQLTLSELREVIAAASVSGEGGVAEDVVRQLLASSGGRA